MRDRLPIVVSALALGLFACGGGEKSAPPPAQGAAAPPAAAAPAAGASAASSAAASTTAEFGVPECDDYLAKYLACVDSKVPEAARAMVRQQLDQTKAAWKQAASTPQGKAGLAMGCRQAHDAAKTSMAAYGCSW
jgi:hypothetical protein